MIERVIGAFKDLGFDLDDREIADILWLSVQMRRSQSSPFPQLQQQTPASTPEITPTPPQSAINQNKKSQKSSSKTETSANVYPQSSQDSNQASSGLPIKVTTAQALRNQLAISRSLKPLKRRVASKSEFILDETATAERIAEEKLLLPVMRPAPERWLELALVIDEGASMMLWKQTIKEFKQLLERHGAFRDVRTWGLFISEDSKVWLRSRTGSVSRQKKLHNPRELIDPNGRRLFVIISDCVSPAWRNGTITKALAAWASTSLMTIIQVLPEWLWERSALGVADSILLRSLAPGVPNQQLIMTALDLLDESDVVNKLKVPVVTLEPESLKNWAWMVAGAGDVQTKGFLLALDAEVFDIDDESTENYQIEFSAKQRLQRFRLTASLMARKLAGLLAAAPVSLPVVRLVRETMLPQSSQVHVAEVFLGGILKPLSPIGEGVDADKIQYDFVDGVRDLLLDAVPLTDSTKVLRKISEHVAQRAGLSVDEFTAMLVNPGLAVDDSSGALLRPFAQVTAKVLRRFGGKYAEIIKQLEEQVEIDASSIYLQPQTYTNNTPLFLKHLQNHIALEEIVVYIRQRDIANLVSKISRHDQKFILIHGAAGAGKSITITAGLVPALQNRPIGDQIAVPVVLNVYTDWARELNKSLTKAMFPDITATQYNYYKQINSSLNPATPITIDSILEKLEENASNHLITVLIFDNLEEFFFTFTEKNQKEEFDKFICNCLNIPFVRIIFSLREDYLHHLLDFKNLSRHDYINHNILDKDIRYQLNYLSLEEAQKLIQKVAENSNIILDTALINAIVKDLSSQQSIYFSPIQLLIIIAQLQIDNIKNIQQYKKIGLSKIFERYIESVIRESEISHQKICLFILYLLTNETDKIPFKTPTQLYSELEKFKLLELQNIEQVKSILNFLVLSGLVVKFADIYERYQLIADYLVNIIRFLAQEKLAL